MAIEPVNNITMRPDLLTPRRQTAAADQGAAPAPAPAQATQPRINARLAQALQAGREASALLSTLPGPNLSFFRPPAPSPPGPRQEGFAPEAASGGGPGRRLNVRLMETMQAGRETSALLSTLMGPNTRAFPAPVPPEFAPRQGALTPVAGNGAAPGQAVPGQVGNALPREGARLLEAEQTGRTNSTLLSGLMAPRQAGGLYQASPFARPGVGSVGGDALATMRTAEQIMQAVAGTPPSFQNARIANEAYQMETRAQREESQRAAGRIGTWEWFA